MRIILLGIVAFLATPFSVQGGEQPQQALAQLEADGRIRVRLVESCFVCKPVQKTTYRDAVYKAQVEKNGQTVIETVTKKVPETVTVMVCESYNAMQVWRVTLEQVGPSRIDGTSVERSRLTALLKEESPVLVVRDKVADYYSPIFKPGTLVLKIGPEGRTPPAAPTPSGPSTAAERAPAAPRIDDSVGFPAVRGPAPVLSFARLDEQGNFRLRQVNEQSDVMTTNFEEQTDEGQTITRPVAIKNFTYTSHTRETPVGNVKLISRGEPISTAKVPAVLRKSNETLVVASADGRAVSSFYLQSIRPDVLIVLFPGQVQVAPAGASASVALPAAAPVAGQTPSPAPIVPAPAPAPATKP